MIVTTREPVRNIARRAPVRSTVLLVVFYAGCAMVWLIARGGWGDGQVGEALRSALRSFGVIDGSTFDAFDVLALLVIPFLLGLATARWLIVLVPLIVAAIGLAIESVATTNSDPLMPGFAPMILAGLGGTSALLGVVLRWLLRAARWRTRLVRERRRGDTTATDQG